MTKSRYISFAALIMLFAMTLWGCIKDDFGGSEGDDGPVSLTLRFNYNPLAEGLTTRGVDSDLDFEIRDLTVLFYESTADETSGSPALVRRYVLNKDYITEAVERNTSKYNTTEPRTRQAYVTIDDIERNSQYRIYAAANIADILTVTDLEACSEQSLREHSIAWSAYNGGGSGRDPRSYSIPDAMFGYFSRGDQEDVIHHNPALGVGSANRAEVITFDKPKIEIHAWMKRVVSRLTIGFDGSDLNEGVEIYIKSVHVKDAVKACRLGDDNHAGGGIAATDLFVEDDGTDARLNLVYTSAPGAEGPAITRSTPAFPRLFDSDRTKTAEGWNTDWYEYVHGNATDILNPSYNDKSTTLYFMENVQGKVANYNGPREYPKAYDPAYRPGGEYDKDGKPCGTYVEVEAYYKNATENTQGSITYRFMLGQNTTDDFNVVRNYHYKLILSFVGDANKADWHIEFEPDEDGPYAWFPIPDESQWEQSWVWHAYNEAGEPVAEICREMVYRRTDKTSRYPQYYYQVVSVYPVRKNNDATNSKYKYTTDLRHGRVVQVLDWETDMQFKAGGNISVLLQTQADPEFWYTAADEYRLRSRHGGGAIRELTDGEAENYDFVQVWSRSFDENKAEGRIIMKMSTSNFAETGTKWDFEDQPGYVYDNKYEYKIDLGEEKPSVKFRTQPYQITDADGNKYSIVKLGGAYWMRDNIKAEHYFAIDNSGNPTGQGLPIYTYKPPKDAQEWQSLETKETRIIEGSADGYDYDFGAVDAGYVAFYERYPMYKDFNGIRLYNYFAATGTQGVNNGGTISYKKEYDVDPDWWANPLWDYEITQTGYVAKKYMTPTGEETIDTSEPYELHTLTHFNLPLLPEGWHALPLFEGYGGPNEYGGMAYSDHWYLDEFFSYDWRRAMGDAPNLSWEGIAPSSLKRGLSGLSILPIPINWDEDGYEVNIGPIDPAVKVVWKGMIIPYWNATLFDPQGFFFKSDWSYPHVSYFATERGKDIVYSWECNNPGIGFFEPLTTCYLPIRGCRNAYDYSVGTIEPEAATNAQRF